MSTAKLTWTNPIDRTDNSPLPASDIASVDVYDDTGEGAVKIANLPGPATSYDTETLAVGNHAFSVYVNDITGHSSAVSNIATVNVPATQAAPNAVTDLAAVLNPETP